jgi:hypothetical protein
MPPTPRFQTRKYKVAVAPALTGTFVNLKFFYTTKSEAEFTAALSKSKPANGMHSKEPLLRYMPQTSLSNNNWPLIVTKLAVVGTWNVME